MRVVSIVGARPQFIKVAPVLKAIDSYNAASPVHKINHILVHTGQHYDYLMSQVFFDELGLNPPEYHLGVGSGTHGFQTAEMLKKIEQVLQYEAPDLVLVYGDTNSTLAGALASAKLHIRLAHVEAGLRSFNRRMPEEINRVLSDHVSDLLFCPTQTAVENLKKEGITEGVYLVGDVMYDSIIQYAELAEKRSNILSALSLSPRSYVLATIHRAENTDTPDRLLNILSALESINKQYRNVILPLHPRTSKKIDRFGFKTHGIKIIEPVSYLDMLMLEKNACTIVTDSGGVQKEAFFFRVPCVTVRDETEWVETVESGWNVVTGCNPEKIIAATFRNHKPENTPSPYGNGHSAEKIIGIITK